ncbi:MAG: (4Fe-4S)-binding protein [Lutimonas sp.]|jgi:uncharacterized Fe-S cluster protein YjdI
MENKEIIKQYSNDDITIVWKPGTCIHAGTCVKMLPKVYNPKAKPWIKIENANTQQLIEQIEQCPSGALSYITNQKQEKMADLNKIEVMANGPLICTGTIRVVTAEGKEEIKENKTAFCRCGHSANKPYCDGKHKAEGFIG